eukprot:TRINITY_DN13064_c0_g1_i1.p1 TRINITY_DN13064_c0_g1~~TRINITY_DN13064_c0_g1_i1.p1  ORF type:complete len:445 (+),score=84.30 TRINITY_DN13064_c0_g1_i1:138-1472(+)
MSATAPPSPPPSGSQPAPSHHKFAAPSRPSAFAANVGDTGHRNAEWRKEAPRDMLGASFIDDLNRAEHVLDVEEKERWKYHEQDRRNYHAAAKWCRKGHFLKASGHVWRTRTGKMAIMFLLYLAYICGGAAMFYFLERHRRISSRDEVRSNSVPWTFGNAVYFCVIALTTIGYGDITPDGDVARLVFCLYAPIGLIIVAYTLSIFGESFVVRARWSSTSMASSLMKLSRKRSNHYRVKDLSPEAGSADNYPVDQLKKLLRFVLSHFRLVFSLVITIVLWFGGAVYFMLIEDWDFVTAFYFCLITLTTIGFGDVTPDTTVGVVSVCFYALIGLGTAALFLSEAARYVEESAERRVVDATLDMMCSIATAKADDVGMAHAQNERQFDAHLDELDRLVGDVDPVRADYVVAHLRALLERIEKNEKREGEGGVGVAVDLTRSSCSSTE